MAVVFSWRFFYRSIDRNQYWQIEYGMNTEEVGRILGEPVKKIKYSCSCHGDSEVWRYNAKYSLLAVTVWFKSAQEGTLRVFDKIWGFIP
ncbi:MAG: hypothetical protein PHQ54_01845 [Candidatus Omnitrophica bacterium]|nr:hypothetical protein [Candidatus Omnitrophota bacterium]